MQYQHRIVKLAVLIATLTLAMGTGAVETVKQSGEASGGGFPGNSIQKGDNPDACGAVLCLAGAVMTGSSPTGCSGYIRKYFEIQVWKHGNFRPDKTFDARGKFLQQCRSTDANSRNSVQNKYGKSRGL